MTSARKIWRLGAVAAALLAIGAAGCGDEEQRRLLTDKRADTLLDLLEDAQEQFEDGDCDKLEETLDELENEVNQVSGKVDSDVREALEAETEELVEMRDECEPAEEPEPEPETTEEFVPPPTETFVPPETITEETIVPETTEETEPETQPEEEPPPEVPPGQENGNSGSGGGGVTPPRSGSNGDSGED